MEIEEEIITSTDNDYGSWTCDKCTFRNPSNDSNLDLESDMFFANAREYCYMLDMNEAQKRSVG